MSPAHNARWQRGARCMPPGAERPLRAQPAYGSMPPAVLREGVLTARRLPGDRGLCARRCGVDRLAGERGWCRAGPELRFSGYGAQFGKEPPLVCRHGSGTIFFSHCTLGSVICQNREISNERPGDCVTGTQLAAIMLLLQAAGCHHVDPVSPPHCVPQILTGCLRQHHGPVPRRPAGVAGRTGAEPVPRADPAPRDAAGARSRRREREAIRAEPVRALRSCRSAVQSGAPGGRQIRTARIEHRRFPRRAPGKFEIFNNVYNDGSVHTWTCGGPSTPPARDLVRIRSLMPGRARFGAAPIALHHGLPELADATGFPHGMEDHDDCD